MAAVEIPWSRVISSAGQTSVTRSGVLTVNASNPSVLGTDVSVPSGPVSLRFDRLPNGGSLGRYGFAVRVGGSLLLPANMDGATPIGGYAYPRHDPASWSPEWTTTGGDVRLEFRIYSYSEPLLAARVSGLIVGPTVAGAKESWDSTDAIATSSAPQQNFPTWPVSGIDGPAIDTNTRAVLAVQKTWTGTKTITVPLRQTGSTMTATLTAPGGATLLSAGGAAVSGSTLTIPPGVQCVPKWEAAGGATLTLTRGTGAVASYAPVFVETPVIPTPPPTIAKLIPTSGPDTGGTLVDIIGTDLTGATAVDFGGTAGIGLTVDPSGGLATVTSPAHTAGPAPVTITTPAGTSNAETFTFEAPPVILKPVIIGIGPQTLCADSTDPNAIMLAVGSVDALDSVTIDGQIVSFLLFHSDGTAYVFIAPPSLPPGTYDLILTNSAGSSDPFPVEYVDCEGCPPDRTVVAVFPGAARPGATIQIVGTNLTGAIVTMCGETVAIVSNDGNIITVVVPPGCPDGPATITVTTPDGETTVEFTVLPPEPVPPADVSPRSWQIAQALLDAAFLCGAECARAFVTTDATPEGPPPGGCPCQLTATIVKDGYKTADGRRLVRSATIKLSLHQCTPIPQADEIPDPDTESDYALRQAETRDQMLRGLATARRQPSSVLGRCQTKQASEGWVHVSTTGGMSLYTMEVTVD